jgi:hypothetical protein
VLAQSWLYTCVVPVSVQCTNAQLPSFGGDLLPESTAFVRVLPNENTVPCSDLRHENTAAILECIKRPQPEMKRAGSGIAAHQDVNSNRGGAHLPACAIIHTVYDDIKTGQAVPRGQLRPEVRGPQSRFRLFTQQSPNPPARTRTAPRSSFGSTYRPTTAKSIARRASAPTTTTCTVRALETAWLSCALLA